MESSYWLHNPAISSAISPNSFSASDFFMGGVVRALDVSWALTETHLILERALLFWMKLVCLRPQTPILSSVSSVLHLGWNLCGVSPLSKRGKDSCAENFFVYVICNFTRLYSSCTLYILFSQAYTVFKSLVQIQVMAKHSYYLGSCFNDFGQLSVTGGPITTLLMAHSDPFPLTLDLTLAIKPSILTSLCCYMCK